MLSLKLPQGAVGWSVALLGVIFLLGRVSELVEI